MSEPCEKPDVGEERIVVCVGPAPSSLRLVRAAARMAAELRCPWVASYVDVTAARPMGEAERALLEEHLRVAETLGATVVRLSGTSVAESLLQYARRHRVTRLVIGKPTHARWRDRLRGSLLDAIVRGSGDIDVHVIRGDSTIASTPPVSEGGRMRAPLRHYGLAALLIVATVVTTLLLHRVLNLPDLEMLFLMTVMVTAVWFGRGPAVLASALAVASYDFFFVPPVLTFSIEDSRYFLTFLMMFGVGVVMSEFTSRLRRQERDAVSREERTTALYELTRALASADTPGTIAAIAARHAASTFDAAALVLGVSRDGGSHVLGAAPQGAQGGPGELDVPLAVGPVRLGSLVLVPRERGGLLADQRAFLDLFCRQTAAALERARLSAEAKQAELRARTEEMRSSLLSTVSHDLRTPLAAITGAATSLRDDGALTDATRGELVESIVDEAERLERLVANLLDMTRLEAGGIALKRDWVPLDETIGSALTRLESRLEDRAVTVSIAPDVPLVLLDPVLFEHVFVNLLENAVKYTPAQSPIAIVARRSEETIAIEIRDRGPGIEEGSEEQVFDKFYRGAHLGVSGAGLGLPICKGIVEAHGGTIRAENHGDGATFRVEIPSGGTPPSLAAGGEGP